MLQQSALAEQLSWLTTQSQTLFVQLRLAQTMSQLPQFDGSDVRSAQKLLLQWTRPLIRQIARQKPLTQPTLSFAGAAPQEWPQVPQLAGSLERSTQPLPQ